MRGRSREREEDAVEFRFEGKAPQPDLLDYRHMQISMDKWAVTDSGWLSLLVLLGMMLFCVVASLVYTYLIRGL